jgi:hypothetical protein
MSNSKKKYEDEFEKKASIRQHKYIANLKNEHNFDMILDDEEVSEEVVFLLKRNKSN